jgi:DNA-binding transcriptional MerR regulator
VKIGTTAAPSAPPKTADEQALSLKKVAELVGVTQRTVRYYHQIGLLDEPRRFRGALVYSPEHLLRLLRIRRLQAMGLSLDDVADVLNDPAGQRSRRILVDLDRALADRAAEIQGQRRSLKAMEQTNAPVDTLPEFARYIAALNRVGAADVATANALVGDIVAGFGDSVEADSLGRLLDDTVDYPPIDRLADLEERLRAVGPTSSEREIAALALDYGQALVDLYDNFSSASGEAPSWLPDGSMDALLEVLTGTAVNDGQRNVLSRAVTVLAAEVRRHARSS